MPYQPLNSGRIYYHEMGEGKPIILLHGNNGSHLTWRHQLEHLSSRYRVLALDMRGFGRSDKPVGADYSVWALAEDLLEFMDRQRMERAVVGGLSMGSMTSLAFALGHQDRLAALILAGTRSDRLDRNAVQDLRELEELGFERYLRKLVRSWFGSDSDPALLEESLREALASEPHVRVATVRALASYDVTDRLPEIGVPTLVIAGELDTISKVEHAGRVAGSVQRGELLVIPGVAHMTPLQRPREVNDAIARFLAGIGY